VTALKMDLHFLSKTKIVNRLYFSIDPLLTQRFSITGKEQLLLDYSLTWRRGQVTSPYSVQKGRASLRLDRSRDQEESKVYWTLDIGWLPLLLAGTMIYYVHVGDSRHPDGESGSLLHHHALAIYHCVKRDDTRE